MANIKANNIAELMNAPKAAMYEMWMVSNLTGKPNKLAQTTDIQDAIVFMGKFAKNVYVILKDSEIVE